MEKLIPIFGLCSFLFIDGVKANLQEIYKKEKSFRDVDVSIDEANINFNDLADWQDPNGDKLILGVIGQVCRVEK